nr:uncharacterized protein LOC103351625 isoform X3 [Oryctolagus cuniculus]
MERKAEHPALTPAEFCFVSGLQPHRRPLIRHPAAPQDPFGRPPAAARLWPTRRRSAGTAGTRVVADGRAARKELRMARDENTES